VSTKLGVAIVSSTSMDASQIVGVAPRIPRWARRALVLCAIWSIPALILATSMYAVASIRGDGLSLGEALLWRWPEWQVWALATPLIVALGRRWPITRAPWQSVPIHLVANAAIASLDIVVYWACGRLLGQEPFATMPLTELLPWMLLKTAFFEMLVYWMVIVADHGLAYQRRYRESTLRQTQLEARLVEAQLDALKMQLHPHFLFNTMNAITVLMRKGESAAAIRMLGGLCELLRRSLTSLRVELVSLHEELDFIERFLEIETTRFPDRLRVAFEIAPEARRARVPNLILQPIVENAIEHGIAPRVVGGCITIAARVVEQRLRIEIRDDGVGLGAEPRVAGHGVGLSHVRKRLAQLYPDNHRFTLEPGELGGAVAILEIPFEAEP
jgi:signal transduction histidine kinase